MSSVTASSAIYERVWRRLGGRLLMGAIGPGMRGERRIALEMLSLSGGERLLDVACGTGNLTRSFARAAGDGMVVGLDASRTMLARAVKEADADNAAYLLGGRLRVALSRRQLRADLLLRCSLFDRASDASRG